MSLTSDAREFDRATLAMINRAYQSILQVLDLRDRGDLMRPNGLTRVAIANLVVDLAREGERDERRLRNKALFSALLLAPERV